MIKVFQTIGIKDKVLLFNLCLLILVSATASITQYTILAGVIVQAIVNVLLLRGVNDD